MTRVTIHGTRELKARFKAIKQVFKPLGRDWTDETVKLGRQRVKVVTGKTRASIRRKNASQTKASVQAGGGARFLEVGTKEHTISAKRVGAMKFNVNGRPVFAKRVKHPGARAQPFLRSAGRDALQKMAPLRRLIESWNRAA